MWGNNGTGNFVERDITVIKEKPSSAPVIYFDTTETNEDKPYETKFVRFAYRWKFTNGQYSVFSPFSKTAFYPGLYRFDAKEGYNTGMENTAYTIQVSNILAPHADIESVDLIIKASDDNTIYIVETLPVASIVLDYTYALTSEQIYSIISSDQLLRLWDAVPLKAKAQVLDLHKIDRPTRVGYRQYQVGRGWLLVASGGTSHGIGLEITTPRRDFFSLLKSVTKSFLNLFGWNPSPFSWNGKKLEFAEAPHMHVSLLTLKGKTAPEVGSEIDVDVRFTTTTFDQVVFD